MRDGYLRTNEHEEAVRSLEWAAAQACSISTDPYYWKWVLISMHNAVQGFMVLALWNGNGLLSLRKDDAAAWIEEYGKDGDYHTLRLRLDDFLNLYKKVKKQNSFSTIGSGPFRGKPSHEKSMKYLNDLRNQFIHFTPKGWSLELAGLPRICMDALDIVEYFGWNSTAILWHDGTHVERAKRATEYLRRAMKDLDAQSTPANQVNAFLNHSP